MAGIDSYTKLMLHMDGADASQVFTDSELTPKTVTAYGTAQIDTAQSKFGGASGLFDGNSDYLDTPDHADWNFGADPFTIDFWIRLATLPASGASYYIVDQYADGNNRWWIDLANVSGTYKWEFGCILASSWLVVLGVASPGLSVDTWYHVALVRTGDDFMVFQAGTQCGATVTDTDSMPDLAGALYIGKYPNPGYENWFNGWLDEFRISKGIARWTANFTPPTAAYTAELTKTLAVSTVVAGAMPRAISRHLGAAGSVLGALLYPVLRPKTLASTVVSSGSLVRSVGRTVLGTVKAAGAIARAVARSVAATTTATGEVIRSFPKILDAGVTAAGAVVREAGKIITAIVGATGTIPRALARVVSVTTTVAGAAVRSVGRILSTSVLVTADMVRWLIRGKILSVTTTVSGALVRTVGRVVAGTVDAASTIPRAISRVVAVTTTAAGTIPRGVTKVLAAASALITGFAIRSFPKILAAGVTVTAPAIARAVSRTVTGVVNGAGTIARAIARTVVTTTNATGVAVKDVTKDLATASVLITAFIFDIVHDIIVATQVTVSATIPRAISRTVSAATTILGAVGTFLYDIAYVMNKTMRRIFAKVRITYTDPYFSAGVEATADSTGRYTYPEQTTDNVLTEEYKWFSLHRNLLDGSFHPLPGTKLYSVGWWGTQLSAAVTGNFVPTYPLLTLTFGSRAVESLLVVGDDKLVEYPVDFTVKLYQAGDVLVHTETVTGNALVTWTQALSPIHTAIVKMTLEITKWSRPLSVCKIAQFFTTVEETYESEEGDLVSVRLSEEREYQGSTIPQGNLSASELTVRLNNIDGTFTGGNYESRLYGMLLNNRAITAWLGVDLYPSGVRRWYPLGTFYSRDWNAPDNEIYAEVVGLDALDRLRTTTFSTSQVYVGASLKTLAETVMTDAGLTSADWDIDAALASITVPYAWFDQMSHREALRRIAAAALGQCYCNRDGKIVLEIYSAPATTAFTYDSANVFFFDNPLKWSEMVNYVEAQSQPRVPQAEAEIVTDAEVITVGAGLMTTKTHFFNQSPCVDVLAPVIVGGADVHVESYTVYAWGILITYHNTGGAPETVTSVTVRGKPLIVVGGRVCVAEDAPSIAQNGRQALSTPIASEFWQDDARALGVAGILLAAYKNPRRDVTMRARGNIAQLLGDRVMAPDCRDPVVASEFSVMSQDVNFDGGLEVNLTAQRITGALMRYYKTVTAETAISATASRWRFRSVVLTAGVTAGGSIGRAIGKIVAALVKATPTVTKTSNFLLGEVNGLGETGTVYATVRDAIAATIGCDPGQQDLYYGGVHHYSIGRWAFWAHTEAVASGTTVSSAKLWFWCAAKNDTVGGFALTLQNGQPTYPHNPIVLGDYRRTHYAGSGGSIATSAIVVGAWNSIALNDVSWITKGGDTKLILRSSRDINGNVPDWTTNETVTIEGTGGAHPPYLEITWAG